MQQELSVEIWRDKYRFGNEQSLDETFDRVIDGVYASDPNAEAREEARDLIRKRLIVPAGRILAGVGTPKRVTYINCFVSPTIQDSMDTTPGEPGKGIMDALKDAALTQQMGGGIGMGFGSVRPRGALVKRTHSVSTGVLPFMDMWNAMCGTVKSSGARRGAMMATLPIWHPDIIEFVTAKREKDRLKNFNVSVLVTDDFMEAFEADADWELYFTVPRADGKHVRQYKYLKEDSEETRYVYKNIRARELWDLIIENTYIHAEPGVIFIDRVNDLNNLKYIETIDATNPCLDEDTLVSTKRGFVRIKDIADGELIQTVDGVRPIKSIERHESAPVYKVSLSDGTELRATAAHIFHVQRDKWFDADSRLDALNIGDRIRLSPSHMPDNAIVDSPFPELTDREYGLVVGTVLGDGCYTDKSRCVKISCHKREQSWIEVLLPLFRKVGPAQQSKSTDSVDTVSSTAVMHRLDRSPVARGKSHEKFLPLELLNTNREFLAGYIDGLISTNGNIHMSKTNPMIRVASCSKEQLLMLKRALSCFGILARIYKAKDKSEGNNTDIDGRCVYFRHQGYTLVILGDGVKKVRDEIGISHPDKAERLNTLALRHSLTGCTWSATITGIEADGKTNVVDLFEPTTDTWITDGVVNRGCGEQPLPPNGDCNLGHVNLAMMVRDPFTEKAKFDYDVLIQSAGVMVRLLDNVIDVTQFPTEDQHQEALNKRRIGLGYTGLANALQMLGIRYGSPQAIDMTRNIGRVMADAAYIASIKLAIERGPFLMYDEEKYGKASFLQKLTDCVRRGVKKHGIRNSVILTLAPTGTTSIVYDNVSSGIEPVFSHSYDRKVLQDDGSFKTFDTVYDFGYLEWLNRGGAPHALPAHFVTANELTVREHMEMQAAAQEFIDSAVSKTINCPTEMTFEEFKDVYTMAYQMGLKGCTTYRPDPRSKRGAILTVKSADKSETIETADDNKSKVIVTAHAPAPMQDELEGRRYRVKWPDEENAYYITINDYVDPKGVRRPFEIFISTKSVQHQQWINALSRTISAIFRREDNVAFLAEELRQVHAATASGVFHGHQHVPSLVAMIGVKIEEHLRWLGLIKDQDNEPTQALIDLMRMNQRGEVCDKCGAPSVVREDGCMICKNCGHSKCG